MCLFKSLHIQRTWRNRTGSFELFSDAASSRLFASSHASLNPAHSLKIIDNQN